MTTLIKCIKFPLQPLKGSDNRLFFFLCFIPGGVFITELLLGIIVGSALGYDFYCKRIPNSIILAGITTACAGALFVRGLIGLIVCIGGIIVPFIMLYVPYLVRGLGAGDIKLICVIGGFLGPLYAFRFVLLVLFCGAIIGGMKIAYETLVIRQKYVAGRTYFRFTVPIGLAFILMVISKGGL